MKKIQVTLKDGSIREVEQGTTLAEFAASISRSLAKSAVAAKVDGRVTDLPIQLNNDAKVEFVTFEDAEGRDAFRHTSSHILAQAVKRLFTNVKIAIGPAIANGFYYDFDVNEAFTPEDLEKIQAEMEKIVKEDFPIERMEVSRDEAIGIFEELGEDYKVELI